MTDREFHDIYNEYSKKLYTYILWMTRNRAAAQDVLQTTFTNVWRRGSVPPAGLDQQRWLYRVARNACLDFFRHCNRFARFRLQYQHESMQATEESPASFSWELLGCLKENNRSIIYLHFKMGFSYKEIGSLMKMTENNVRVKAFRALKQLREEMVRKGV